MSVFKSQFARALKVIPTDNANIPTTNLILSGTTTDGGVTNYLIDENADFLSSNIASGDIVYTLTDTAATVVAVVDANTLILNANITPALGAFYYIYNNAPETSMGNPGCNLYFGNSGNVTVTTIGQDIVTFFGVQAGTVLPVQVIKVHSSEEGTTVTSIIALW
jgi:hypothetical protein